MSETTVTREDRAAADHWATRLGMRGDDADDLAREFAALRERAERAEQRAQPCGDSRNENACGECVACLRVGMDAAIEQRVQLQQDVRSANLRASIATAERDTAQRDAAAARAEAAEDAKKAADERQAFFERLVAAERERDEARALLREARTGIAECEHNDGCLAVDRLARIDAHLNAEPAARTTSPEGRNTLANAESGGGATSDDATAASAAPVGQPAKCATCPRLSAHLDVEDGKSFGWCGNPWCCAGHADGWTIEPLTAPTAQRKGT